jgi:hypothetical protein
MATETQILSNLIDLRYAQGAIRATRDERRINAKQTQFPKKSNGCNLSSNSKLQRKMDNGHLVKTNPIKPNFRRVKNEFNPLYDKGI